MKNLHEWIWRGEPGHYILANRCCFHLHTIIGNYRISTVGALYERDANGEPVGEMQEVGPGRFYETYVYELESDGAEIDIKAISKIDFEERKNSIKDLNDLASKNHINMCYKYAEIQK